MRAVQDWIINYKEGGNKMTTEEEIRKALEAVIDPEIGISVVDLGMIREIEVNGGRVEIKMVLTAPGCPLADYLVQQVQQAAQSVEGITQAHVILLHQRWDPSWMRREKE